MKALNEHSLLSRLLNRLATVVLRHPRVVFLAQVLLLLASIGYTIKFLQFDTDSNNLISGDKRYQHNFNEFQKEFPQPDDLVVVVESENIEKNRQFIARLGARMQAETNQFADVLFQKDMAVMGNKGLQLAKASDLVVMRDNLVSYLPFVRQFTVTTNLVSLFEGMNRQFRTAKREANDQTETLVKALPVVQGILQQAQACLAHAGSPPPPSLATLFGGDESDSYITFANGRIFLATAHALNNDANAAAIDRLRQLINETKQEVPGVNVGLTGTPVLDQDQMEQSQKDTMLASVVSLVLCALIFIYGYNETGRPIKATICLLFGLGYALAFATLSVGNLNILTITFLPMLIGLAIDFGVHLITRYEEELRHGKTEEAALRKAMVFTGQGIFMGALTTAGAFLAMALTNFKGIREMGLICGGGLMISLVPMMTLLPVFLLRGRQNVMDHEHREDDHRARIENLWLQRPVLVVLLVLVISAVAATQARKVRFDYDLLHLQSAHLAAVDNLEKLIHQAGQSLLFGAVVADNLDEAVSIENKLRTLTNVVASVDSAAEFLHQDQGAKLKLIAQIKAAVAPLQFDPPDLRPVDIYALSSTLYSFGGYLGAARDEIGPSDPALARQFASLQGTVLEFRKAMLAGDSTALAEHADKLGEFQRALFNDLRTTFEILQAQDDRSPIRLQDLPPVLRDRFVGVTGKYLLQVYPKKDIWQRPYQKEFVETLRHTLDPQDTNHPIITGAPVQLLEYTSLLKDSYLTAAWYSLAAISLIVLIHFRSFLAVILALLPVGIGTLWLIGLMGAFGLPFNPANIMTLPLVIGIGVTNGIHILNRFAEERTPGILSRSTGKAVLVSGLTAIAGFGSLILARHRGIHSLGVIMAVGIATCMVAALMFVPALLSLLGRNNPLIKKPGADEKTPAQGQEEPR
jgi:hypothetical protein